METKETLVKMTQKVAEIKEKVLDRSVDKLKADLISINYDIQSIFSTLVPNGMFKLI